MLTKNGKMFLYSNEKKFETHFPKKKFMHACKFLKITTNQLS